MVEWTKICCAVDFSDASCFAMAEATDLARRFGAELTLIHVHELPPGAEVPLDESEIEMISVDLERSLAAWRAEAGRRLGGPAQSKVRVGDPAKELVRFARDTGVDLIVVGSHGDKGLRTLVLGSVAERVIRDAPCPVLVIRQKEITDATFARESARSAAV